MSIQRRIIQTLTLAAMIFMAAHVVVLTARAASITNANDYPSTLQVGQSANHQAFFTTPTGVLESSTITLSFSASFDTSSLIENDIDVADDGVDLTTAGTCAGVEQASVTIASDVVTITICAGDGGAIAAGSQIAIEIGTNATASGTGVNRITNPSTAGTYFVTVAGAFGDDGSIALPIGSDDSVSVSVQVPSRSGGGGVPGGGGDADTTPPTISNVLVSNASASGAVITWVTNEAASSMVDYGLTTAFELGTIVDGARVTSHSMTLSGLSAGQTYYFRARSADSNGNLATSSTMTFVTADTTAPAIIGIGVDSVTTTSARVFWTTNEPATSIVSYGLTTSYGTTRSSATLATSHSILLTRLLDGTVYHFQVLSADASSNQSYSSDQIFATVDDVAPANVSSLAVASGDRSLSLGWVNPTDADLAGARVIVCMDTYPSSPTDADCSILSNGLATSFTHTGLINGRTYYYGVFVFDVAGQFASGALVSGHPSATEEEPPSDEEEDPSEEEEVIDVVEEEEPGEEPGDEGGHGGEPAPEPPSEEAPGGETPSSASGTPTSLSAEVGEFTDVDIAYLVANGAISLKTTDSGVVEALPASTLLIQILASEIGERVESVHVCIGEETFLMRLDEAGALYEASVTTPSVPEIYPLDVTVRALDGFEEYVSSYLRVVASGHVTQVIDGEEATATSATVTLFERVGRDWVVWDGSPYGQFNPTQTQVDGTFAWYVPNGSYYVLAQADGFTSTQSSVLTATNSIANPSISIVAIEKEEEETVAEGGEIEPSPTETPSQPTRAPETIVQAIVQSIAQPIAVAQETLETIRELPGVETVAEISTPTLAVAAGAGVVSLAVAFDFLPFLQYFFTAPVLLFWRRKRKSYGVVYNAIAKTPIDLSVVRLFQVSDEDEATGRIGRLVKSRVTDKGGRYFFLVGPGKYRLVATKVGYQFPTAYLKGDTTDGQYLDVYHGEPIVVGSSGAVLTANIPLDPSQADKFRAPGAIMFKIRLRFVQHAIATGGLIAAFVFAVIRPNTFSLSMIGIQVVIYLLVRRLAKPHKPISWGIVYDKMTGRPIARAVARIFEPKYNKVLETQVTDTKGRYAFLLGPNEYFAMFEKDGYASREVRPIDYSKNKEPKDFSDKVPLDPV